MNENLGEELRVLYVALTRAKEKLYLSGTVESIEKMHQKSKMISCIKEEELPLHILTKASGFMDWIWYGMVRNKAMVRFCEENGFTPHMYLRYPVFPAEYKISVYSLCDVLFEEMESQINKTDNTERFLAENLLEETEEAAFSWKEELKERLNYIYPYENERSIPSTISVTELKRWAAAGEEADKEHQFYQEPVVIPYVPDFMKESDDEVQGNVRGTAYHRVMECLVLKENMDFDGVKMQMEQMMAEGKILSKDCSLVSPGRIFTFTKSDLSKRMYMAQKNGKLYREQQFVMGISPKEVGYKTKSTEPVLVQGIIDAFFEEDGEFVIVDYKTDRVRVKEELLERYRVQLELYTQALEKAYGKKVKEKIIYSFCLGETLSF